MPRPREHNTEEVREATYRCFWENGFSHTSLADLRQSTGLEPRQFLRDYGNKQGVFKQALHDFSVAAAHHTLARLERGQAGISDIRESLGVLVGIDGKEGSWGCLICNTSQDKEAMADEEVAAVVQAYFIRIEKAYRKALSRAVRDGEIVADSQRQRRLARSLMSTHVAIMMLKRSGKHDSVLRDIVYQALAAVN